MILHVSILAWPSNAVVGYSKINSPICHKYKVKMHQSAVWSCVVNIMFSIVYRIPQPDAVLLLSLAYLHTVHQYGVQCLCKCIMLHR